MHSVNSVGSLISYCVAIMTALVTLSTKVSGVDTYPPSTWPGDLTIL